MNTKELLKKANTKKVSGGQKFAYMVLRTGYIFFDYYETGKGTVEERDPSHAIWGTYKIGEEAVKVIRTRKQVVTETYTLAK